MKLALLSSQKYERPFFEALCPNDIEIDFLDFALNGKTANLKNHYDAVCVFVNDTLSREVIQQLGASGIKLIALRCAGFNNVDIEAAKEFGIRVCRVPAYSPEAVAEHALALMLTLSRKTHKAYNRVREDNFDLNGLLGFNLHGKTVGLVGCGKIGRAMVRILGGFGCHVQVSDPNARPGEGYTLCALDELFASSDIISLHCPLNEQTHHIIDKRAFSLMKPGVMLVNTGRGALVDTPACIQALKEHKLGYLGLDVYEQESELFFADRREEIIQDDVFARLLSFPNVLVTGHQGFFTREALEQIAATTFANLREFIDGKTLTNEVI